MTVARPALLRADIYPNRPIRVVVPFAAGGGTDVLTRIMARGLTEKLGQQLVVENRTGAGGNIAMENVIRSPADGYSLMMGTNGAIAVNRHLYRGMGFDPLTDFAPVGLAFSIEHLMAVTAGLRARTVQDVIEMAKREPGMLTFGSGGSGSMIHLAGELFRFRAGIDITHVPYRGGGPAMNDLAASNISMMFDSLPSAEPQVRGGRVRALALCGRQRHKLLPDLPTMVEAGVPDYFAASTGALFAPKETPAAIIARINGALKELAAEPAYVEMMGRSGGDATNSTPQELAEMMRQESQVWGEVVKAAKLTAS
jgi:tripartite-type tricarboxylate transporter receptor subunit TctC